MDRNLIFIILGVIIIAVVGCFILIHDSNNINVGGLNFKIPDNYTVIDENNNFNLTNGKDSIIINKKTTTDINKTIKNYIKYKAKSKDKVQVSNYEISNTPVYKASVENSSIAHYWFEIDNKVYELYTWSAKPNNDFLIKDLITSAT